MAATFRLTIGELLVVDELPDAWTDQKYREILERLEIPNAQGVPHEELLEMCIMALQDLEPLFRGAWLISKAFPQVFAEPQIARVDLRLAPHNEAARKRIAQPLNEATLLRLLAQVMDPSSILLRMFGDQIRGGAFSEAEYLLWAFAHSSGDDDGIALRIHASRYMLRGLPDEGFAKSGVGAGPNVPNWKQPIGEPEHDVEGRDEVNTILPVADGVPWVSFLKTLSVREM